MKPFTCCLCHRSDVPHNRRDLCEDCQDGLAPRNLAWCTKGRHRVEQSAMTQGDRSWCRACRRAANKRRTPRPKQTWYAKNKEKIKAYKARPEVRERNRAWRAAYYEQNRDAVCAYNRERYQPGSRVAYAKAWLAKHPGYHSAVNRRYRLRRKMKIVQSWRRA